MKVTRADKMEHAYRLIQKSRRSMIRNKFAKDLSSRPWVEEEIRILEEEYDQLTERGVQVVRSLCEEIVLH